MAVEWHDANKSFVEFDANFDMLVNLLTCKKHLLLVIFTRQKKKHFTQKIVKFVNPNKKKVKGFF